MGLPMRTFYDEIAEITIDDVKQMTTSELVSYLEQQINMSLNTELFIKHDINGAVLYYTQQNELQSLGLNERHLVAVIPVVDMDGVWDSYNIDSITIDIGAKSAKTILYYDHTEKMICGDDICKYAPTGELRSGYVFVDNRIMKIQVTHFFEGPAD
ncbi:hypothetical protein C1646_774427 [Rhizophagus diaphanus]|nr:hypothetical protein C1646_774427 [Rhizophagus diaphanus] [Rhizophagus sp. MUCL 43196]